MLMKHKLDMLEPGIRMLAVFGIISIIGLVFYLLRWDLAAYIAAGITVLILLVLMVLLIIEAHQDKVLNERAIRENKEKHID